MTSFVAVSACGTPDRAKEMAGSETQTVVQANTNSSPGASAKKDRFIIFSPSVAQADYFSMHRSSFTSQWNAIASSFDAFNIHGYNLIIPGKDSLGDGRVKGLLKHLSRIEKSVSIEMQMTTGLIAKYGSLQKQDLPAECKNFDTSFTCGELAAAHAATLIVNNVRKFDSNIVTHLLLDSVFYDAYFQLQYWKAENAWHSARASEITLRFIDGYASKMKEFVPGVKLIYISHFKYEFVNDKPGLMRNGTSNTLVNNVRWTNEETTFKKVFDKLPGRFSRIMFDASWSSFYDTPEGWKRWDHVLLEASKLRVPIGMIVHTDNKLGSRFEDWFHENHRRNNAPVNGIRQPFSAKNCNQANNETWKTHTYSYLNTIQTGAQMISNYNHISDLMIASWHKYPFSAFDLAQVPEFASQACGGASLATILKTAAKLR
jgi:hypothetical protein